MQFTFQYGQIYYIDISNLLDNANTIYIPIWLDLLFYCCIYSSQHFCYLHSNMVRFIIGDTDHLTMRRKKFTFQYGQIYYARRSTATIIDGTIYIPIWLDLLCLLFSFEFHLILLFTFQYGQIYYYQIQEQLRALLIHLHSNMVRFIIRKDDKFKDAWEEFTFQYGQIYYSWNLFQCYFYKVIYIPIWLDLLCLSQFVRPCIYRNLHSNMVRFIISCHHFAVHLQCKFTFQYGQIYYKQESKKYNNK